MNGRTNPFFELYLEERITGHDFVTIFSPFLVPHAQALFLPGNVVVTGVQGSGKSMLLSLLKTDVRLQYAKAGAEFPVPKRMTRFIGAGINLAHSNAIDFGLRPIPLAQGQEDPSTPLFFGDFLNYYVVLDIFANIEKLAGNAQVSKELGIDFSSDRQRALVDLMRRDASWVGYLGDCTDIDAIRVRMGNRLDFYTNYLHMNVFDFDDHVMETKTSVGMPISSSISNLVQSGIIPADLPVFVHIDQFEELANIVGPRNAPAPDYRRVVNRALARRDPAVSYRIGTRGHAWHNHGYIYGANAKLEEERDYKFIDLDQKLRRNENPKTWIFPSFATDVFLRRLNFVGHTGTADGGQLLKSVFGSGVSAEAKALRYAGKDRRRAVKLDADWPLPWREYLLRLAETSPLSARLGEAWCLQEDKGDIKQNIPEDVAPWDARQGIYWRKERVEQALVQIAGRCAQRPVWTGVDEIIHLSGGNILIFLSICQHIWDYWLQSNGAADDFNPLVSKMEDDVQAIGIFRASEFWLNKIKNETGRSGDRARFVRHVAEVMSRELSSDRSLTNPGYNGFSLKEEDLARDEQVREFLEELSDYGNLLEVSHTTKSKDRKSRTKWYLNPILCPQFKIPYKRLKEPMYVTPFMVRSWMHSAGVAGIAEPTPPTKRASSRKKTETKQLGLFTKSGQD